MAPLKELRWRAFRTLYLYYADVDNGFWISLSACYPIDKGQLRSRKIRPLWVCGSDGTNGRTRVGKLSIFFDCADRQFSPLLSKAILVGIGTFAATGLILVGGQYIHRQYRNHRNLQLIQQSDTLFSSTPFNSTLLFPGSLLTLW